MKLEQIEVDILEFPPNARYKDGVIPPGRPQRWQFPLVKLTTDTGITGHSMVYGPHGDGPAMADILLKTFWPEINGHDPREVEAIWSRLFRKQRDLYNLSLTPTSVLDVALWDIRAKDLGLPLYKLLGSVRESLPCYASCRSPAYSPEEFAEEAIQMKEKGFHGYKLQVFSTDPAQAIACLRAARAAVGYDYPLMIDLNGQLSLEDALVFGQVADECGAYWLEEPCDEGDLHAYDELTRSLKTPILAGETSRLQDIQNFLRKGALDIARGDVLIKGGVTGFRKMIQSCEQAGYGVEAHTTNTPILDVANFHVACSIPKTTFIENHHPIFRFALTNNPMEPDSSGWVHIPKTPGLGIELDMDWIQSHTVGVLRA